MHPLALLERGVGDLDPQVVGFAQPVEKLTEVHRDGGYRGQSRRRRGQAGDGSVAGKLPRRGVRTGR